MEARYYNAQWGRFLQQDPVFVEIGTNPDLSKFLLDPQQLNAYAYARNNPLRYKDPTGKSIETEAQQFGNGVAGLPYSGNSNEDYIAYIKGVTVNLSMGVTEIGLGSGMIATGGTMAGTGVAACATGAGCLAGAPAIAVGATIATAGGAAVIDGTKKIQNGLSNAMQAASNQGSKNDAKLTLKNSVSNVMGKSYKTVGEVTSQIKNKELLNQLNATSKGDWVKVYEAGVLNGNKIEVHYFRNNTTGQVFDVKQKYDYWYQASFKNLK